MGGLFSSNKLWSFPAMDNAALDDCNNVRNGIYRTFSTPPQNIPSEDASAGAILVAMSVNSLISLQIFKYLSGNLYSRIEWGKGNWLGWVKH